MDRILVEKIISILMVTPTQIELTFSSYSQYISIGPCIPSHLDQPSDPRYKDIDLKFSI